MQNRRRYTIRLYDGIDAYENTFVKKQCISPGIVIKNIITDRKEQDELEQEENSEL